MAEDLEAQRAAFGRRLAARRELIASAMSSIRAFPLEELEAGPEHPRSSMAEDMEAELAACELRAAAIRERLGSARSSIRAFALSTRSGAHQAITRREHLDGFKKQMRDLQADLGQALSLKFRRELKCERIRESISAEAATNEQLVRLLTDQRDRRGRWATAVSNGLESVEALEAKADEHDTWRQDIEKSVRWYHEFLGFQVVTGGEGVKFVFDKVDLQSPEKEFSFSLKIDNDRYTLLQCNPAVEDSEELMKDLNLSNDLAEFARKIRQRFQAAALNGDLPASPTVCSDASTLPISSPVIKSVCSRSKNDRDRSSSQSKNRRPPPPAKRKASALSAASSGSVRRSSRLVGEDDVQNLSQSHQIQTCVLALSTATPEQHKTGRSGTDEEATTRKTRESESESAADADLDLAELSLN